jgi:Tfp pilus assembly protein PilF
MRLHGVKSRDAATRRGRRDLSQGIANLKAVVQMSPGNWAAYWIMGKAYQAQGLSNDACDAFASAYLLQNQNADVAREFMFECLNVGRTKEAVELAYAALQLRPDEPGLKANLALCLLVDAQLEEALGRATEALQADPNDKITRMVKRIIEEVQSGTRPQPRKYGDLKDVER